LEHPVVKRAGKQGRDRLYKLSDAERSNLEKIEAGAIEEFTGTIDELESALGMLRLGPHVGWKVLYVVHSKKTIRKYEQILTGSSSEPVRIRELFQPEGPSSYRSVGFRIVERFSNFWKAISGDAALDLSNKRVVDR
jgi:hypothetical protein